MRTLERCDGHLWVIDERTERLIADLEAAERHTASAVWNAYLLHPEPSVLWSQAISCLKEEGDPMLPQYLLSPSGDQFHICQDGYWVDSSDTPVTLRHVIAAMDEYHPAVGMHRTAQKEVARRSRLNDEMIRLEQSPIVLARAAREKIIALHDSGCSWSAIAKQAGALKKQKNSTSGDVSWLKRRLGLTPEPSGKGYLWTPWCHLSFLERLADAFGWDLEDIRLD